MPKIILTAIGLVLSFFIYAQSNSISGTILDEETGEGLIGANVLITGTSKGAVTDVDGKFLIKNVSSGSYTLKISYYGYEGQNIPVTVVNGLADIGSISLKSTTIGLEEVQVFADVVEERKTPIAISTISETQLDERYGNLDLADAMQNTPGIYTTQGAGGYGDQEIYIRGFDQTNVAFLVNGIPVNDMENGRMYWSNFAGLNQVTRTMQVQRGLGASKLAVSSIGGTINMITKPSEQSEGGRLEYQTGTGSWTNRSRFTYHTGQSDDGWAVSFQGSRTTTNSNLLGLAPEKQGAIMPGAYVNSWSYYLSISKQINEKHSLMFWTFGAPVDRGTAWSADDVTREQFNIDEPMFNNALGIKNGEIFNARQNKVNKPLTALTHYWDLNSTSSIMTSIYYSRARVYSVQPRDSESSLFFPTRYDNIGTGITADNLIDWDYLSEQNRTNGREVTIPYPNGNPNIESITGYDSRYYLEARHNDHDWIGLVSNYTKQIQNIRLRGGIDLRHYKGSHYATVFDLMGGDFIQNESRFGDEYNKLQTENAIAREGDKTNYNYDGIVNWQSLFGQAEWTKGKWILFGSATITHSDMQRVGHFWSGNEFQGYESTSLGASEKKNFMTYTLKGGANYLFNGRHNVYVNAGFFTRPPYLSNAFQDSRYSNNYRYGLDVENIASTELGYGFKTPYLKANLNAYYLVWNNRTTQVNLTGDVNDGPQTSDFPGVLSGLQSTHKGIEIDLVANPTSALELNGYVSIGDWKWSEVPNQQYIVEGVKISAYEYFLNPSNGGIDITKIVGLPVGAAAQRTAGVGFHYKGIPSTYVGGRLNYANRIPISYQLEDVTDGYLDNSNFDQIIKSEFDSYATVDVYMGRYFDVGEKMSGRISANVNNVFDNQYVRWASFFGGEIQRSYGFPRTFTIGLSLNF